MATVSQTAGFGSPGEDYASRRRSTVSATHAGGLAPWKTHEVANQAPPLEGVDVFSSNLPAGRGAGARGRRLGARARRHAGPVRRRRAAAVLGAPGEREQADPPHARPLRQPHRRGRVPPRVAQPDADGRGERAALAAVDEPRAQRARRPRRAVHDRDAGRGRLRLPDHDDLRGGARAARAAGAGGRVGAADHRHDVRPAPDARRARRAARSPAWR